MLPVLLAGGLSKVIPIPWEGWSRNKARGALSLQHTLLQSPARHISGGCSMHQLRHCRGSPGRSRHRWERGREVMGQNTLYL